MEINLGTNVVQFKSEGGSKSDIEARIKAFENPETKEPVLEQPATPPVVDQVQDETPLPPKDSEKTTVEVPQQFQSKDGKLDEEKIQKSNEHLRRGVEERQAKLIRLNKELREKFREMGTKVNQEKAKADAEASLGDIPKGQLTPEQKKKIAEELEKDPVEAILAINRIVAKQELEPHINDIQNIKQDRTESRELRELDELVESGHDWIVSEGLGRFEAAFKERPWLRQSNTPYRDALKFIDAPSQQPIQAPIGPRTPILGASRAVPPPSAVPSVSPDQQLAELSTALRSAIKNKDFKSVAELEAKMDMAYKGRFP